MESLRRFSLNFGGGRLYLAVPHADVNHMRPAPKQSGSEGLGVTAPSPSLLAISLFAFLGFLNCLATLILPKVDENQKRGHSAVVPYSVFRGKRWCSFFWAASFGRPLY